MESLGRIVTVPSFEEPWGCRASGMRCHRGPSLEMDVVGPSAAFLQAQGPSSFEDRRSDLCHLLCLPVGSDAPRASGAWGLGGSVCLMLVLCVWCPDVSLLRTRAQWILVGHFARVCSGQQHALKIPGGVVSLSLTGCPVRMASVQQPHACCVSVLWTPSAQQHKRFRQTRGTGDVPASVCTGYFVEGFFCLRQDRFL